jgi:hypothetical protein
MKVCSVSEKIGNFSLFECGNRDGFDGLGDRIFLQFLKILRGFISGGIVNLPLAISW